MDLLFLLMCVGKSRNFSQEALRRSRKCVYSFLTESAAVEIPESIDVK